MRLAVVLPAHRLWGWHQQLIAHLRKDHEVAIYLDHRAPAYRWPLRIWLKIEQALLARGQSLWWSQAAAEHDWPAASELVVSDDTMVLNLSEQPLDRPDALELRYDGVPDSAALIDRLLARQTPHLSMHRGNASISLTQSRPAIEDKLLLMRGLRFAFARCISLIDRALHQTSENSLDVPNQPRSGASLLFFVPRLFAEKASDAVLKPFRRRDHWMVALRDGPGPFVPVADDGERYYADPFLQEWQGRLYLFVEEFPYAVGKGIISAAEVIGGRVLAPPVPVLERPYHLSYPFVLNDAGTMYMMPETGANRTLELYRAVEFPWKWELESVLMRDAVFADSTPFFYQGRWWLFTMCDARGTATQDELFIFYADKLSGPWLPHAGNPLKSDCQSSRSAGRIIEQDGRLFRPAQDCGESYGAGLVWMEITELSPTSFSEKRIADWDAKVEFGVKGLHTFDHIGSLQAIDVRNAMWRGALRRPQLAFAPRRGSAFEMMSRSPASAQLPWNF
jgi:hypothetical protein